MRIRTFLLLGTAALMLMIAALQAKDISKRIRVQDLSAYWSAAQLAERNPYSESDIAALEKANRIEISAPLIMRNPPWLVPMLMPFRFMSYETLVPIWIVVNWVILTACAVAIWRLYGGADAKVAIIVTACFAPAMVLVYIGQVSGLVLLGIVGFLGSIDKGHEFRAGLWLLLILIKPHVAWLFLLSLLLWIAHQRKFRLLLGGVTSVGAATAMALALNRNIFHQYATLVGNVAALSETYPTAGGFLSLSTGRNWAAYVPAIFGLIWLVYYWAAHREHWSWAEATPSLLLASMVTTAYAYVYDEAILLVAILPALIRARNRVAFVLSFTAVNGAIFAYSISLSGYVSYMFLCWTSSAWALLCVIGAGRAKSQCAARAG